MKKKLLASLLALVLVLGMLPMAALAEGEDTPLAVVVADVAEFAVLSKGGEIAKDGTTTIVTFGSGAELNYADANNTLNRGEGYHAGIKMLAPTGFTGTKGSTLTNGTITAKYRKITQWWNITGPDYDEGWGEWTDITLDGDNYMEFWGLVNPGYFGVYGNKEEGILYNHYQFDWTGNGKADQDVFLNVTKEAVLKKDNVQVWPKEPMDVSSCGVLEITKDAIIEGGNTAEAAVNVTINATSSLQWFAKGSVRPYDGWWIGFKAIAPKAVNDDDALTAVKYRNNNDAADKATFKASNDGKIAAGEAEGDKYKDQYYIQLWGGINEDVLKNAAAAGKDELTYVWYFNWDGDTTTGTNIAADKFNPTSGTAAPMYGVDQIITLTFKLSEIKELKKDNEVKWEYSSDVKVEAGQDGKFAVDSTAAMGAIAAASGENPDKDSEQTATISVTPEENATDVTVIVPAEVFTTAAAVVADDDNTAKLNLAIDAGAVGSVTLDSNAVKQVSTGAGSDSEAKVTISIEDKTPTPIEGEEPTADAPDKIVEVKVEGTSGNLLPDTSASTNGKITITIPAPDDAVDGKSGVWYGKYADRVFTPLVNMNAKVITVGEAKSFEFTTNHLSAYATYDDATAVTAAAGEPYAATGEVMAANLTAVEGGTGPDFGHAKNYDVEYDRDNLTITIKAEDLERTTNAQGQEAYWVGVALKKNDGYTYAKGFGAKPTDPSEVAYKSLTTEQDGCVTTYWGFASAKGIVKNTTGWLSVKDSSGKIVDYKVVFAVKEKMPEIVVAPIADNPTGGDEALTDLGTVTKSALTSTANGYTFTLTGTNIKAHKNSQGTEGTWVGFGMPIDGTSTYTYSCTDKTNANAETIGSVPGRVYTDDNGAKYNTIYFDESGTYTVVQTNSNTGAVVTYVVTVKINEKTTIGGGGGGGSTPAVATSSNGDGKVSVSNSNAKEGDTVTITATPNSGKKVDTVTVTGADGKTVTVTDIGDNKYTFVMPKGKVTVKVTFVDETTEPNTPAFTDVEAGSYYADAVAWAIEKGITNGTSDTTFSPNASCTRAQMVTFLWRLAGSPKAEGTNPFADIAEGSYYYDAVMWAVANGITNGTSDTTFSPDVTVSRAQSVTFLYRYAGKPEGAEPASFDDVAADAYYAPAVAWAAANGITNGTSDTTFSPDNACIRAQIVTFMYRYAG